MLFIAIIAILVLGAWYLYSRIRNILFRGKDRSTFTKDERRIRSLLAAVPIALLIVACVIRPYIVVVPVLHLILFWAIIEGIVQIVEYFLNRKKKSGEETKEAEASTEGSDVGDSSKSGSPKRRAPFWLTGALALGITVIYMLYAYYMAIHVYKTEYTIKTNKDVAPLRIALIADSHIGTCFDGHGFAEHIKTIEEQHPDVLVISGDFVDDDTDKRDMVLACRALGEMQTTYGVFYVPGNHDAGYGDSRDFTYDDLLSELRQNGVKVLEDESELVGGQYYIVGRKDRSMLRLPIERLMMFIDDPYYTIVLDHQPNDYDAEAAAGCDLVLSGHTHGGQMIPIRPIGELIGANDATYGLSTRGNTTFIVTSGIADWAVPYKTGTISEYCIIDIEPN